MKELIIKHVKRLIYILFLYVVSSIAVNVVSGDGFTVSEMFFVAPVVYIILEVYWTYMEYKVGDKK